MRRITVASHKGGSGKTTVAVNLAGALAAAGRSVLVVDADPQGAAGAALGISPDKPGTYEVLTGEVTVSEAVRPTSTEGVDIVAADLDLAGAEVDLPTRPDWQRSLRRILGRYRGHDVVVIDTAPGLGVLPYLALAAADQAIVVCPPDFLALRVLPSVLEAADQARVDLVGIVLNGLERRTLHEADVVAELQARHAGQLLSAIPRRVVLRDATIAGRPVSQYAPTSDAAEAFARLAQEVLHATST